VVRKVIILLKDLLTKISQLCRPVLGAEVAKSVKWLGYGYHSPPFRAEVKNAWSNVFTPTNMPLWHGQGQIQFYRRIFICILSICKLQSRSLSFKAAG
jgi:hypothetical protein